MRSSIAKLTRPRFEAIVERSRLLKRLDHSVGKIVWISAPAGSGKTTLVAHWLESRKQASLWYQADEGDRDIASFFSYLGQAVRQAAPKYRTPLPLLTPEYRQNLLIFTKRFFEELFRRLVPPAEARNRPKNFVIVIDNYQDVPLASQFHEVLRSGLEHAPAGISIFILSRSDPPPMYARQLASKRVEVLGQKEIWFTFEESKALARLHEQKKIDLPAIKLLFEKTQGWAAGLVLFLESATVPGHQCGTDIIPRERIFDYFASEMFDHVDSETRGFLLASAFLPRMSAGAAAEMTDFDHADRILNHLSRHNFFIQRHATPEIIFQYHPLFREFLLKRAHEYFSVEDAIKIRKKAALILVKTGQAEDAAAIMTEIKDWQGLTGLILHDAKRLATEGRFLTLGTWINSIPRDIVEQNGWLLYWKAMGRLSTRPAEARANLEGAYPLFIAAADSEGSFLTWAGIVDTFMYEWKDFKPLDRWIEEFAALRNKYGLFPSKEVEERSTSAVFAALMYRQPQHPDLPKWEHRVRDIMMESADLSRRIFIGYNLIHYFLWTGRTNEAGALVTMLSPVVKDAKAAVLPKLMCLRAMALYHLYTAEPHAGLNYVDKGLALANETGVHVIDLGFFGVGIYHATLLGDVTLAEYHLERMNAVYNQESFYARMFHASQSALVSLLRGHLDTAVVQAETSARFASEAGVPLIIYVHESSLAIILAAAHQYDKLTLLLPDLKSRAALTKSCQVEAWCAGAEAQRALNEGNDVLFAAHFRVAVDVCKRSGLRSITWLPTTLARLCEKALELDIATEFVKEIIRLNNLIPASAAAVPVSWPYPLKIRTLGRFVLFQDDTPMVFTGKVQQKPLALLKAIVALGCNDVDDRALADALWPDAEGDQGRRSLDITLFRLRKLLPNERVIQLQNGRVGLDERYCWVDARAFEQIIDQAGAGMQGETGGIPLSAIRGLERAIALYRDHFLAGESYEPWVLSMRERLRSKYLGAVGRLGRHLLDTGQYERAVDLFQRGIEVDDLSEGFYQNLMLSYLKLGCKAEAATTYNRCRSNITAKLGITPSEKTEEIYRMVKT